MHAYLSEFAIKEGVTGAFEEAGSERAVHLHGCGNDDVTGFVRAHRKKSFTFVSLVSFVVKVNTA